MQKQLGFSSLPPQQRLAAVTLWHVMPPPARRAAASAERLTATRWTPARVKVVVA